MEKQSDIKVSRLDEDKWMCQSSEDNNKKEFIKKMD